MDLSQCLEGDAQAWHDFVTAYAPVIFTTVRQTIIRHCISYSDADIHDTTQDVFVKLIDKNFRVLRTFDPSRADLKHWLAIIARRVAIDGIRKRRLAVCAEDQPQLLAAPEPTEAPARITLPLELLSPRQRQVIRMIYDENKSIPEIAAALGVDDQTVRSTKHAALTCIRGYFGGQKPG